MSEMLQMTIDGQVYEVLGGEHLIDVVGGCHFVRGVSMSEVGGNLIDVVRGCHFVRGVSMSEVGGNLIDVVRGV